MNAHFRGLWRRAKPRCASLLASRLLALGMVWLLLGTDCARAEDAGPTLAWLARSHPAKNTSLWLQVHPQGHAWFEVRAQTGRDSPMHARTTLELGFQASAEDFRSLEASWKSLGLQHGDFARGEWIPKNLLSGAGWEDFARDEWVSLGLGAPPRVPTHTLRTNESPRVDQLLDRILHRYGISHAAALQSIQTVLRDAALSCLVARSAKAAVVLTRSPDDRFIPIRREGTECVLAPLLSHLRSIQWPSSVVQVAIRTELAGVAAGVEIAYDPRVPLRVDEHKLEDITELPSREASPNQREQLALGVWSARVVRFRPAMSERMSEASVDVVNETELAFPAEIWTGPLSIRLRAQRGRARLADGHLEVRNDKLRVCRGIKACDQITAADARGLVAAALAQCRRLRSEASRVDVEPLTGSLQVAAGTATCTVSLTHRCLPTFRHGLGLLFERLSSPAAEIGFATLLFRSPCMTGKPDRRSEL